MRINAVIGRTGCGKTTLAKLLAEKPALLVPHDVEIELDDIKGYRSVIFDDIALHSDDNKEFFEWIAHYGRRYVSELWFIGHYYAHLPASIRSAVTTWYIGRMDARLMPPNFRAFQPPSRDLTFYAFGDYTYTIRIEFHGKQIILKKEG